MVTQTASLQVQPRAVLGKHVRKLRSQGVTPIHLYGKDTESQSLQVDSASLRRTLELVGRNQPVTLRVEGLPQPYVTFVRDVQFHPLNNSVLHVDFLRVDVSQTTRVEVPIFLEGESSAARLMGGSLIQTLHTLIVEALPLETPEYIAADASTLTNFEKAIHVSDLDVPPGVVAVLTDADQLVARVTPPVASEVARAGEAAPQSLADESTEADTGGAEA